MRVALGCNNAGGAELGEMLRQRRLRQSNRVDQRAQNREPMPIGECGQKVGGFGCFGVKFARVVKLKWQGYRSINSALPRHS